MYEAADYFWEGKRPGLAYLHRYQLLDSIRGGVQAPWDEIVAEYSLKDLTCGNTGVHMGGWFRNALCFRPQGSESVYSKTGC